jgi:NAD(P)-dependent dehydrogenase (short-subunit alcohol dehydrogenase family)
MSAGAFDVGVDLTGHTVVTTGGTGVLGRVLVAALIQAGASVALIVRDTEKARAHFPAAMAPSERLLVIAADVTDGDSLRAARDHCLDRFARIDALVNGAGGNLPEATTNEERRFFDLGEGALRDVIELNLVGTILPCQVFAEPMVRQGEGAIVNITSMNALRPLTRIPAYSAAKAGVANFTQWLAVHMAQEYSPRIRVNAIAPGFFLTEQNRFLLTNRETGELTPRGAAILAQTPMGRFGEPTDLVGAFLWLLSPAASFVTGVIVPVDGGFSAFGGV